MSQGGSNHSVQGPWNVKEAYYFLFRNRWLIVPFALLGLGAAAVIFLRSSLAYLSEAKLFVRYVTESVVMDPENKTDRVLSPNTSGANVMNTEVEILSSRDLVEATVDQVGIERFGVVSTNVAERLRVVDRVMRSLKVSTSSQQSSVIWIGFESSDPALAQEFVRVLVERYLARHNEVHRAVGASSFLEQQTEELRRALAATESELQEVRSASGVLPGQEARTATAAWLKDLQRALQEAEANLASSQARVEALGQHTRMTLPLAAGSTNGAGSAVAVSSSDLMLLRSLREREAQLLQVFTEGSIPVREIRRQIGLLQQSASPAGTSPSATNRPAVPTKVEPLPAVGMNLSAEEEANLAGHEARVRVLRAQLAQLRQELMTVDAAANRIADLERKKEILEANYRHFAKSLEEIRIDDALQARKISNISIIQPATYPSRPFRPHTRKNILIALVAGLAVGLGLAYAREYVLDHSLRRPADVEGCLGVPTLLTFPRTPAQGRRGLPVLTDGDGPRLLEARAGSGADPLEVQRTSQRPSWDIPPALLGYFEALHDRLLRVVEQPANRAYVLGVTSCVPRSGVSTIAAGLAITLARNGEQRVLVVHHPRAACGPRLFWADAASGLVDAVADTAGNAAAVRNRAAEVSAREREAEPAGAGTVPARYSDLVHSLQQSSGRFVIVDLPPVTEISPTLRYAGLLDGVLLVVGSEEVDRDVARRAKQLLIEAGANVIGTVFNKHRQHVPTWLQPAG